MTKTDFLQKKVLSSGLIKNLKDKHQVEAIIEIRMLTQVKSEVTFADFLSYASGKIKKGVKQMALHKNVIVVIKNIFLEYDPDDADIFTKCLPSEELAY